MPTASSKKLEAAPIVLDPVFEDPAILFVMDDIGVDLLDPDQQNNIRLYLDTVKMVESSGGKNTIAKKQKSGRPGARGDYQWFPGRFQEDLNAAALYHRKAGEPVPDWIIKAKKHKDPTKLNATEQERLFLFSLYRFPGSNAQLKAIADGDLEEGKRLYQERWHGGKPKSQGGFMVADEWEAHQKQVDKYFKPAIQKASVKPEEKPKDPIRQRQAETAIEAITDYDSILSEATREKLNQRLEQIKVTAQRKTPELFPVSVTAQRKEPELMPVSVTAQRKEPELMPVSVTAQRKEPELMPVSVTAQRKEPELMPVSVTAQRKEPELMPVSVTAQRKEPELMPVSVTAQRK